MKKSTSIKKLLFIVFIAGIINISVYSPDTYANSSPQVKKSKNSICHEKGSTYYSRTKRFTSYPTMEACLNSGGRRPKR